MSLNKCIAEVERTAGRPLEEDERQQLADQMSEIISRAKAEAAEDAETAILKAVDDFTQDMVAAAVIEKRNAVLNKRAQLQTLDYLRSTWSEAPWEGLEAVLVGVSTARQGARDSVGNTQLSLFNSYSTGMIARLEREGVHSAFTSGKLDREIWCAMYELSQPEPNTQGLPKEAVTIARILEEYNELARRDANQAGAWIKKRPGRVIRQTHDPYRITRAGFEEWKAFVSERIDWARTMPGVKDADAALEKLYKRLASGVHVQYESPSSEFKGMGNIGRRMSHERVIHFKDADAAFEYNKRFGAGSLAEGMLYGLEQAAQDIGIMRKLGPNAEMNITAVIDQIMRDADENLPAADLKYLERRVKVIMGTRWPNITGASRIAEHDMLAAVSSGVRFWQQTSKLGAAALSAAADIPFYASEVKYQGGSFLGGMTEAITGLLEGKTPIEQKELLGMLGVLHDGMRATVATRFDARDSAPGAMAKATQVFFKLSGLRWWTDRLRAKFALASSHRLALHAGKAMGDLPNELQRVLSLFSIDEGKWNILRQGVKTAEDGRGYMTPEGINDLPDEVFAAHLQSKNQRVSAAKIRDLRTEIKDQFRSYFHDRASTAVIEPDSKTRAILLRGTRPGTVEGEFLGHLTLFKTFVASVLQRVVGRELYGRTSEVRTGFGGLLTALKGGNGELQGLAQLMAWNTLFGYGAMTIHDLAKGREPRDPGDARTWMAAMAQGGSLGIYGDFLFGDMKNRFGGSAVSTLAGPTAGVIDDVTDLFQRFRDGDDTAAQAFRFTVNNTPFINLFYTKWALDYAFLYRISESLNPGYLRRMERRIEKENEQEFIVPPSSVVPYGGG